VHARVADQISALTGEQSQQRQLIVLVRLDPKLAPMVTIGHDVLVELGDFERAIHVLRVLGANSLHEPLEYAVEIVHEATE
jgi:hypothetical protein